MDGRNIAYRRISEKRKEKEKTGSYASDIFLFGPSFQLHCLVRGKAERERGT
jgi:hypothetical protein